jgi:hypothetical protein
VEAHLHEQHEDFQGSWQPNGCRTALGRADGCYQTLSEAQRLLVKIDDEPVCEIDASSSNLTILHGLPLPPGDLYDIPPFPRRVIKWLVTAACRLGKPLTRWPDETPEDIKAESVRKVGDAITERYPFFRVPHKGILPARYADHPEPAAVLAVYLMAREAAAITRAMGSVRKAHPGELLMPVHDSIVCRRVVALEVEDAMRRGYREACGATPRLTRTPDQTAKPGDF